MRDPTSAVPTQPFYQSADKAADLLDRWSRAMQTGNHLVALDTATELLGVVTGLWSQAFKAEGDRVLRKWHKP